MTDLLLKKGADPNCFDSNNKTPLSISCYFGHPKCIDLLVEHGADVNYGDKNNTTPLHCCFFQNKPSSLKALLKHKPKTNVRHKLFGITPIEGCFKNDSH